MLFYVREQLFFSSWSNNGDYYILFRKKQRAWQDTIPQLSSRREMHIINSMHVFCA